jgi:putative radical SAM enzyme (TIGR03279 family)
VLPGSIADNKGIKAGDVLVSLNGKKIRDAIDYMFTKDSPEMDIVVSRNDKILHVSLEHEGYADIGIELEQFRIKPCNNKCIFCFVNQLPKGLRKPLYLKDDDYRMSFLYGNYITLSNLSAADRKRIEEQHLSPLYISVHTTSKALRSRMLGNPKATDIMDELNFLRDHNIRMHAQIVLCPGLNDGQELRRTLRDLYSFYPHVMSIAVVPVGLTAFSKEGLKPVAGKDAESALDAIDKFQKRLVKKHDEPIIYGADELYIIAGRSLPPLTEYGDLPQIENGVGMVRLFVSEASRLRLTKKVKSSKRFLTFTGVSFYPFLKRFVGRMRKNGINITSVPVSNTFFGNSVTVAGLLTGRDVINSIREISGEYDVLLVPDVVLKESSDVFLDDVSVDDIEGALGIRTKVVDSSPEGLVKGVLES